MVDAVASTSFVAQREDVVDERRGDGDRLDPAEALGRLLLGVPAPRGSASWAVMRLATRSLTSWGTTRSTASAAAPVTTIVTVTWPPRAPR